MNTAEFWDKRAQQYEDAVKKHNVPYEKTIDRTTALLGASDRVLDFGCGTGEFSVDLAPQVREVHGIDTSAKMIDLARKKARDRKLDNCRFDQADVDDPDLRSQSYSSVLAFSVLHLVRNAPKTLARVNELLATNGLLISETPCLGDRSGLLRFLVNLAQKLKLAPAIHSFTCSDLESLFSDCGFEIVESRLWDKKNSLQWIVARKRSRPASE